MAGDETKRPPEPPSTQLELAIPRERVPDRNYARGGRSFYFFDLDDNVFTLETPIFIFDQQTRAEVALSTRNFALIGHMVGKPGPWERYAVDPDDRVGSFRRFRDHPPEALAGRPQPFVEDLLSTLSTPDVTWKGPSWEFFEHAVFNGRAIAIITARGHHPETICEGLGLLHERGWVKSKPNIFAVYPVSHFQVRRELGDSTGKMPVPQLKRHAIIRSVEQAMQRYGKNPHHRFGISDDAPENVELSIVAMRELKRRHPDNAFFVIDASRYPVVRTEVLFRGTESRPVDSFEQLDLL